MEAVAYHDWLGVRASAEVEVRGKRCVSPRVAFPVGEEEPIRCEVPSAVGFVRRIYVRDGRRFEGFREPVCALTLWEKTGISSSILRTFQDESQIDQPDRMVVTQALLQV